MLKPSLFHVLISNPSSYVLHRPPPPSTLIFYFSWKRYCSGSLSTAVRSPYYHFPLRYHHLHIYEIATLYTTLPSENFRWNNYRFRTLGFSVSTAYTMHLLFPNKIRMRVLTLTERIIFVKVANLSCVRLKERIIFFSIADWLGVDSGRKSGNLERKMEEKKIEFAGKDGLNTRGVDRSKRRWGSE